MTRRVNLILYVLIPAVVTATAILGYYTWKTASQFEKLGEETIVESLLPFARAKVNAIETLIMDTDAVVFPQIAMHDPEFLQMSWDRLQQLGIPSIQALAIFDENRKLLGMHYEGPAKAKRGFRRLLMRQVAKNLDLDDIGNSEPRYLHEQSAKRSYLFAYTIAPMETGFRVVLAWHDTAYLLQQILPDILAADRDVRVYNVVDSENQLVYGPDLVDAGDYVVRHRFPTTLYDWSLQVAPKQAALLQARTQSTRKGQFALPVVSLIIIVLAIVFLGYAATKERQLNEMKSEFLANVSHELKTPLSVVRMYGELLLTGRVPNEDKKAEYLEMICLESERLTSLIENVLDFSALQQGKQVYEFKRGDIMIAVERAIETFRYRIERQDIELKVSVSKSRPEVYYDEQSIILAVINLLDNAAKYGGPGEILLQVLVDTSSIRIQARDHGKGIPSEEENRVFERFYRSSSHRGARGSGIGLALVHKIATAHGGEVWATNAPGGGAIVGFSVSRQARIPQTFRSTVSPDSASA